jgi:hypothetical protein
MIIQNRTVSFHYISIDLSPREKMDRKTGWYITAKYIEIQGSNILFYSRFRSFKTALPTFGMIALGSSLFNYWCLWLNSVASQYMIKKTLFISCQWTFHLHLVMLSESEAIFCQQFHIQFVEYLWIILSVLSSVQYLWLCHITILIYILACYIRRFYTAL